MILNCQVTVGLTQGRNPPKLASQTITQFSDLIMNRDLAIGLLSRASNGNDLLAILDSLEADQSEQTINEITEILF